MGKKEFLIIFLLAFFLVGGIGFLLRFLSACESFPDVFCEIGWPLAFYRTGGFMGVSQWLWLNLFLNFLFWFLVLAAGWQGAKKLRPKK